MSIPYSLITDPKALGEAVKQIKNTISVAMDIEADSMFHYREKVCLIQVAQNHHRWVIDPLALHDLSPLAPIFADHSIEKIFHGADYDIRSLYRDFGFKINNLFDTELACRFLGLPHTGLAHVLKERFQVQIDKKYQRKDWSKRPLPTEMIDYAMSDVAHLTELATILKKELEAAGRYEWVKEECQLLCQVRPTNREERPLFQRFNGAGRLDRRSLAVLEALLTVRDDIGRTKDRPVFKIIGNKALMQMAVTKPVTLEELNKSGLLSKRQFAMYAGAVVQAINTAMSLPVSKLPLYPQSRRRPRDNGHTKRMKALKEKREAMANFYNLSPGTLLSNTQIINIAHSRPSDKKQLKAVGGVRTWQAEAFGQELLDALNTPSTIK